MKVMVRRNHFVAASSIFSVRRSSVLPAPISSFCQPGSSADHLCPLSTSCLHLRLHSLPLCCWNKFKSDTFIFFFAAVAALVKPNACVLQRCRIEPHFSHFWNIKNLVSSSVTAFITSLKYSFYPFLGTYTLLTVCILFSMWFYPITLDREIFYFLESYLFDHRFRLSI